MEMAEVMQERGSWWFHPHSSLSVARWLKHRRWQGGRRRQCRRIAENIVHGESGLLFEAGNADALAQQIETLLADRERRQFLGQNAARRAGALWHPEVIARQHIFSTSESWLRWVDEGVGMTQLARMTIVTPSYNQGEFLEETI